MKTTLCIIIMATPVASLFAVKPAEPPAALDPSAAWTLSGNAGTNASANFVGTTDNQPLELRVNNQRALRLEPSGIAPNLVNVLGGSASNHIDSDVYGATMWGGADTFMWGPSTPMSHSIGSPFATISGGAGNKIGREAYHAAIAGGFQNAIGNKSWGATILGAWNTIGEDAENSTISGGSSNRISDGARCAFVAGGVQNIATGDCSFAAGQHAEAGEGSFVWADTSSNDTYYSKSPNEFRVRATGGLHLHNKTELYFGDQARQMINLWKREYAIGVQTGILYQRSADAFAWFKGGAHSNAAYTPGYGGTMLMTLNSGGLAVNGTFISKSDRNAKENFVAVNPSEVLAKVLALPLSRWNYKDDPAKSTHVGPMAQDFHAAFQLGADDKHIATVDADGVALAAIQGLYQQLQERDDRIADLNSRIERLEALLHTTQR